MEAVRINNQGDVAQFAEKYFNIIELDSSQRYVTELSEANLVEEIHRDLSEQGVEYAKTIAQFVQECVFRRGGERPITVYALVAYHLIDFVFNQNKEFQINGQDAMDQMVLIYFLKNMLVNRELQVTNNCCQRGLSYYVDKLDLLFSFISSRHSEDALGADGAATAAGSGGDSDSDSDADEDESERQLVSKCKLLYFILKFRLLGCILYKNVSIKKLDVDQFFSVKHDFESCCHALQGCLDELSTVVLMINKHSFTLADINVAVKVSDRPVSYQISTENYAKKTIFPKVEDGSVRKRGLLETVVENVERLTSRRSEAPEEITEEVYRDRVTRYWTVAVFLIYMFADGDFDKVDRVFGFNFSEKVDAIDVHAKSELDKLMERVIDVKDRVDYSFAESFADALTFSRRSLARQHTFRREMVNKISDTLNVQVLADFVSPILKITTLAMLEGGYFNRIDRDQRLTMKIDMDKEGTGSISALYQHYVRGYYYDPNQSVKLGWNREDIVLREKNAQTGEPDSVSSIPGTDVAFATMIHELTHFVAEQVYSNMSRPYFDFSSCAEVLQLMEEKEVALAALQRRLDRLPSKTGSDVQRELEKIQGAQGEVAVAERRLKEFPKAQLGYVERVQADLRLAESRFNQITLELMAQYHASYQDAGDGEGSRFVGVSAEEDRTVPVEGLDDLLVCVFREYPVSQWHAEFIARVPQIMLLAPNRYRDIIPAKLIYYFQEEFIPMVQNYYIEAMLFHTNHLNTVHGNCSPGSRQNRGLLSQRPDYPPSPPQGGQVLRGEARGSDNTPTNLHGRR